MSDFDDQARDAGERVRRDAERLAATIEPFGPASASGHGRTSRWMITATAILVVLAGVGGLLTVANRDSGADDVSPPSDSRPATTTTGELRATTEPTATTAASPTAKSTTEPTPTSITRPIVDPAVCESISATGGEPSGLPRDFSSNMPLTLFARPSEFPVPIQVIGEPVDGQAKPFAVVLRYFGRPADRMSQLDAVDVNGTQMFVGTFGSGNGEAEWTLPDGSVGYLRSRGFDRQQLVDILGQLTPRATDAPIPGFDYGTSGPEGLSLIAERLNTEPRAGGGAGSQCQVESTGFVYRVYSITGPDVLTYASVIDRPVPNDVGVIGDRVIIINGPDDPSAPTADDVIDADEETWRQLLIAPEPDFEFPQVIGGGADVVVDFVPLGDTSVPVSSLTLRIDVQDGVAFLEVYLSGAVIADAAEFWKTEIDGRIRSRSSATPGDGRGVFGSRIGDAPLTEEFTVRISTTDGDDQTIQTTGTIRLVTKP